MHRKHQPALQSWQKWGLTLPSNHQDTLFHPSFRDAILPLLLPSGRSAFYLRYVFHTLGCFFISSLSSCVRPPTFLNNTVSGICILPTSCNILAGPISLI